MFPQSLHLTGLFPLSCTSGTEVAKLMKEDAPAGQLESKRHSCSRAKDRSRWYHSPLLNMKAGISHLPLVPLNPTCWQMAHSLYEEPQLANKTLQIQEQGLATRCLTLAEEKLKTQIRFDVKGDLGNPPTLPQGITLFLAEGVAEEWDDAPGPFTSIPKSSPQYPSEGSQCHTTHTGGARPKVPPGHLLVDPSPNPNQSCRNKMLSTTPIGISLWKWNESSTPTGGKS